VVVDAVPVGAERVLDVGCGEGVLTRALAARARHVVGIDIDAPTLDVARRDASAPNVEYVLGDFLDDSCCGAESFDAVVSVAVVHHIGTELALRRLAELVRPGGVVAVVGLARSRYPADLHLDVAGAVSTRVHKMTKSYWETSAPKVWPPDVTYRDVREIAGRVLPGSRFRRYVLWRWSVVWTRPSGRG
jgi:2-polyprenyl-3-methyl-5-hydroxy-6-metoxy-1,4-benzoquinol methylase